MGLRFILGSVISTALLLPTSMGGLRPTAGAYEPPLHHRAGESVVPPPGHMVDIGGYRLHLNCTGSGSPTVILIHGLGGFSFDWSLVQPAIARMTRVCSYDRAGQAWSDPGPQPRGIETITKELHALLAAAHVGRPYVLASHSWGGLIPRMYEHLFPGEVAGIVFVDSSSEGMSLWVNGKTVYPYYTTPPDWEVIRSTKYRAPGGPPAGAPVMIKNADRIEPPFTKLPEEAQRMRLWARALPRPAAVVNGGDWGDVRLDLKATAATNGLREYPLGRIPVVVVSGTQYDFTQDDIDAGLTAEEKYERKLREDFFLAHLSSSGKVVIAKESGHHVHIDQPNVVIQAIRDVVRAARSRRQPR